jgi:uncharacterized protein YrrD
VTAGPVLMRASEVVGLPVVSIDCGEDVAEVKDVVYSPDEGRLLGFTLNKRGFLRGRMKEVLTADSVAAVGHDAVMIEDDSCLVSPADAPEEVAKPAANRNVLGNTVITETGTRLGEVTDLILELGDRLDVVGYQLKGTDAKSERFIPLPAQLAVSGQALVVPAPTEEFVFDDLSGFGAGVAEFRARLGR